MKKFTFQLAALLFLIFVTAGTHAQIGSSKWTFSNPKPFGFTCNQIAYADNSTAVVVGYDAGIARTTDGGGTWSYISYATTNADGALSLPTFNDVMFVNSTIGYAVGNDGIMIKTIDAGINWSKVTTPFFAGRQEINTVWFTDANTGYIGGDGDMVTRKATMYKTTNGGASWQAFYEFPAPPAPIDYINGTIYKIRFTPTGIGYVGGAGGLVWKYDGSTWVDYSITKSTIFPNVNANDTSLVDYGNPMLDTIFSTYANNTRGLNGQNYRGIAIVNDTAVVVSTQNNAGLIRINTSTQSGSYLMLNNSSADAPKYSPLGGPQMYNLMCRDGNTIVGAGSAGIIFMSSDKGFNWQTKQVYPAGSREGSLDFFGINVSPSGRIGVCGQAGVIADSITQWRRPYIKGPGCAGNDISFADALNGVEAGGSGGAMVRTTNGGNTWEDISNPSLGYYSYTAVANTSPNTIYAAATNSQLYKSVDKGTSFDLLFLEPHNGSLNAMYFKNEDTGWVTANCRYVGALIDTPNYIYAPDTLHQFIYHTTDAGLTWDSSTTSLPFVTSYLLDYGFNNIQFWNAKTGYAVGNNGTIYKSTDGGLTWAKQTNIPAYATDKIIMSVSVIDDNVAFASGWQGLVMKTINGGSTWTMSNTGLPGGYNQYNKILMYDASQGLVFTNGAAYATKDGGGAVNSFSMKMCEGASTLNEYISYSLTGGAVTATSWGTHVQGGNSGTQLTTVSLLF